MADGIRPFDTARPSDREAVLEICVRTGDAGSDATGREGDPRELTDRYASPYLDLAPEWAFVAEVDGAVVGYLVGVPDTEAFAEAFEKRDIRLSEAERAAHAANMRIPECVDFPAHLHVNLLPAAQGRGLGRALVEAFLERLREASVGGVHLVVDPRNAGALRFYPRVGFTEIRRDDDGVVFVR